MTREQFDKAQLLVHQQSHIENIMQRLCDMKKHERVYLHTSTLDDVLLDDTVLKNAILDEVLDHCQDQLSEIERQMEAL